MSTKAILNGKTCVENNTATTCLVNSVEHETEKENRNIKEDDEKQAEFLSLVPLSKRSGACKGKKYDNVMDTLKKFQSESEWPEHERLIYICLAEMESTTYLDFEVVLNIEQGTAELMQKRFCKAKKCFHRALTLSKKCENVLRLQGRALMFLGNTYRKQGPRKYGKALKYLTLAEQSLALVAPGEDKAELNYLLGSFYLNLLSTCGREPSEKSYERIEKYYEAVYDFALLDSATRVHEKIYRIFPLGMANFFLDCHTELARARAVPERKVKRAEDCLTFFSTRYPFDQQSVNMQAAYLKAKSDLAYRQGNILQSQFYLQKGLDISIDHKYNLEVQSFEKRIEMLRKSRLAVCPVVLVNGDKDGFADESASVDTELNTFSLESE